MNKSTGLALMLIGGLIGSPFLFYFGFFTVLTAPTATVVTTAAVGTTAVAGGAAIFTAATLGIGAAVIYGAIGLGYGYYAAKDAYNGKGILEVITSRFTSDEKLTVGRVFSMIGSALWVPFLLLGAIAGTGYKAAETAITNLFNKSESAAEEPEVSSSHSNTLNQLGSNKQTKKNTADEANGRVVYLFKNKPEDEETEELITRPSPE